MSVKQPTNQNFLSSVGFDFSITRLPNVEYFLHKVNLPGVSAIPARQNTPFNVIKFQPDHLEYEDLIIEFKVDEDMKSWIEIYNWIKSISFPKNYAQHRRLVGGEINAAANPPGLTTDVRTNPPGDIYSDATLIIRTSKSNANIQIDFRDMYPINLSSLDFISTAEDIEYLTATATFLYQDFIFKGDVD